MSVINSVGVTAEIIGVVADRRRSCSPTPSAARASSSHTGGAQAAGFGALLVGSLMAAYVMVGFDTAGELARGDPQPAPDRARARSCARSVVSGIGRRPDRARRR